MEYGAIGFSEEEAIDKFGADNLEVYHIKFNPLEWRLRQGEADDLCYSKLICLKNQVLLNITHGFLSVQLISKFVYNTRVHSYQNCLYGRVLLFIYSI